MVLLRFHSFLLTSEFLPKWLERLPPADSATPLLLLSPRSHSSRDPPWFQQCSLGSPPRSVDLPSLLLQTGPDSPSLPGSHVEGPLDKQLPLWKLVTALTWLGWCESWHNSRCLLSLAGSEKLAWSCLARPRLHVRLKRRSCQWPQSQRRHLIPTLHHHHSGSRLASLGVWRAKCPE